ncbi:MAG TPA: DNA methyltransferase, partial [Verrucomicrobiota bacterium]|nr:DNA methyltransferase [Verrucomicrobiota bacterium]
MNPLHPFLGRVTQGDCIHVLRRLPEACVDLVLTDPPYLVRYRDRDGRGYPNDDRSGWLLPAFAEVFRVLRPGGLCVCFYGWPRAGRFLAAWHGSGFYPVGHFVFTKRYTSRVRFTRMRHEQAYLLAKGRPALPEHPPPDVLAFPYTGNPLHPTQKPVAALLPLIAAYSRPGDLVLDPFAGSGSTGEAAR